MSENSNGSLSVKEVAQRLGVTTRTVARWIKRGLFPGARRKSPVPKSPYRIPEEDVANFERRREELD